LLFVGVLCGVDSRCFFLTKFCKCVLSFGMDVTRKEYAWLK